MTNFNMKALLTSCIVCILSFALLVSYTKAASVYEDVMCPAPKMCPNPSDSETCITVEQFFQMRLGVCPGCGTCVESDATLDSNGCPIRTCEEPTSTNECDFYRRHKQFIMYNSKMCPDCDAFTCHVHWESVFSKSELAEEGGFDVGIAGEGGSIGPGK